MNQKRILESIVIKYYGANKIQVPESITRNLKIEHGDFLLIEFKDNSIMISPVDVSKKGGVNNVITN